MAINKFKLTILILVTAFVQLLINNQTALYLDCVSIILVVLLLSGNYTLGMLVSIALFADFIGHWYLGSHLFAALVLSFLAKPVIRFFHICSIYQKIFLLILFYFMFVSITTAIDLITHNVLISGLSFAIETIVFCPIVFILFKYSIIKNSENIIL